jgi:hypothetical protein
MEIPSLLMAGSLFVQALRLDLPAYKRPLLPPFCSASVEISRDLTKTAFPLLLALLPVRSGDHDRHHITLRRENCVPILSRDCRGVQFLQSSILS